MQEKTDKQYTRSLGCDNFNVIVVTVFYDFIRCYKREIGERVTESLKSCSSLHVNLYKLKLK